MKYRIQFEATFNNKQANGFLDHVESIKTQIYKQSFYTEVDIIRETKKTDVNSSNVLKIYTDYETVDFDSSSTTHIGVPVGSDFRIKVDLSFSNLINKNAFLNYIEGIKLNANVSYLRHCRFFDCCHDEKPLIKDGAYSYIDFDGTIITH